jgi:NAD+ kinase
MLPIIAVKAGRRNHLLDIDPKNIGKAFDMLIDGRYKKAEYPMIEAKYRNRTMIAFNEIGITSAQPQSIIVGLKYGKDSLRLEGDGVLVSTPQGSTGWAFSANGVYLDSRSEAFILTVLNPVMNPLRSIVIPEVDIELELHDKGYLEHVNIVVDGMIAGKMNRNNKIKIKKSSNKTVIYRFFSTDPIKEMLKGS